MRSKRREQEKGLDKLVGVALTLDQVRERGEMIAGKVIHIESLKRRLKQASKDIREEIKQNEQAVAALARVITAHEENKAQRDLFIHQVPQEEATKALAEVAKRAEPLPSQPHQYRGEGETCSLCGSDRRDGVHADVDPAWQGHDFEGPAGTVTCAHAADGKVCGLDRLSHAQKPEPATNAEDAAAASETDDHDQAEQELLKAALAPRGSGNGNGRAHAKTRSRKKAPARAKPAARGRRAHP